jgi:hypothetical protein
MADESPPTGTFPPCPWCSAPLDGGDGTSCPACGAAVAAATEAVIPGVTAIDAEAVLRAARAAAPKRRSRLLSWISGDYAEDGDFPAGSVAPPDPAVQREMLRLELAALEAAAAHDAPAVPADPVTVADGGPEVRGAGDPVAGSGSQDEQANRAATGHG